MKGIDVSEQIIIWFVVIVSSVLAQWREWMFQRLGLLYEYRTKGQQPCEQYFMKAAERERERLWKGKEP